MLCFNSESDVQTEQALASILHELGARTVIFIPTLINLSCMLLKQVGLHAHFTSSLLLEALMTSEGTKRVRAFTQHRTLLASLPVLILLSPSLSALYLNLLIHLLPWLWLCFSPNWRGYLPPHPWLSVMSSLPETCHPDPFHQLWGRCLCSL